MQFHLFLSNTYQNAFLQVLHKLKKESENNTNKKHFFVVPDRITLNAEKRIFEELKLESTFDIEVITLSKLANRVLGKTLDTKKVLTKQSAIMLTTKVVLANKHKLKAFFRATHFSGFIESIYETIMQLKSCNITPSEFLNSQTSDNISLKLKVQDIATLYEAYEQELLKGYLDASSKLNLLNNGIPNSDLIKNANFYFALFDSFTPQQYHTISKLVKHSNGVNIGVCSNTLQNNSHIYPTDMYESLTNIAKQYGMSVKDIIINDKENLSGEFNHLLQNFYAYKKPIYLLEKPSIKLFEATHIKEEVEFVASSIVKLAYENERYFNINVAVSDMSAYAPIIEEVFSSYNIPYYLDKSTSLLEHHYVLFLMQSLKTAKNSLLNTDVLSYTKNYFSGFTFSEQNLLEDAVLKYGINYTQFKNEFAFLSEDNKKLESLRKKIIKDLSFFNEKENSVSHFVQAVFNFLEHKNVVDQLATLEKTYEQDNNILEKKRTSQVYEKVQKILLELNELLGEENVTFLEFYELLLQGLKATTLSTIPVSVDCVFVGEAANNNFVTNNTLFVLGATDDALPKLKADVGIILEDELKKLNEKVPLQPSIYKLNQKAKFNLFQLFLIAKKSLSISYSRQDEKQKEQKPSSVISEFQKLFYVKGANKNKPLEIDTLEKLLFEDTNHTSFVPFYYANKKVATQNWLFNLKQGLKEDNIIKEPLNSLKFLLNKTNKQKIDEYLNNFNNKTEFETLTNAHSLFFTNERTKVSQLESYFSCPFKHFLDYGLKLQEKERAGVRPIDVGNILHKVAEQFGKMLKEQTVQKQNLQTISKELIKNILSDNQYASIRANIEFKNILSSLASESFRLIQSIFNEQQNTDFKLSELEFSFGKKTQDTALTFKVDNKTIYFSGVVDRIDFFKNYFRIIDYKTGKSEFSFKELYFGKKIQLFLYAYVYSIMTGKTPAGVFYFPIKNEFEDEGKTTTVLYKMQGAFLNNLAVVKAFDKTLSAVNNKSNLVNLAVKFDSSDNLTGLEHYTEKRAFTEEEFGKIEKYIKALIEKALNEIEKGNITPSPIKEGNKSNDAFPYNAINPIFVNLDNFEREIKSIKKEIITEAK